MENYKVNIFIYDPYVLNQWVDSEWNYSEPRIELLKRLGEEDKEETTENQKIQDDIANNQE